MKIGLKKFTEDAFKKLQKYCLKNITSLTSEFVRVFIKKLKLFLKGKKDVKPEFISFLKEVMPYNCVVCGDKFNKNKENKEHIEHVAYHR